MDAMYQKIYKALKSILGDLNALPGHKKLKAEGFMDLNMDRLFKGKNFSVIALSHYYKHPSGDMIPDPDMEIRVFPLTGEAEALTYQDSYGFRRVYDENESFVIPTKTNEKAKKELNEFLLFWLNNLRKQGFKREEQEEPKQPEATSRGTRKK